LQQNHRRLSFAAHNPGFVAFYFSKTAGSATIEPFHTKENAINDIRLGCQDVQCQVDRKMGFFMHLAVYFVINSALVLLNALRNSGWPWVLGPFMGRRIAILRTCSILECSPERNGNGK